MAKRNVIVRRLPAVEGLGSGTAIASDKTGTLTENKLAVKAIVLPQNGEALVEGEGHRPAGELRQEEEPGAEEAIEQVRDPARPGARCNEAESHLFNLNSMDELAPRILGFLEPRDALRQRAERWFDVRNIDLFLVPGVACDHLGGRLGTRQRVLRPPAE